MRNYESDNQDFNTATLTQNVVTGIFHDKESAERAYTAIENRGYGQKDINVVMSDKTRDKLYSGKNDDSALSSGSKTMEGAGTGSAIGGTIGAIAGAIAAIGTSLAIPGLGIVIAGPIAAALAGAGAGGFAGGLVGALIGSGIPENDAKRYEQGLNQGNIVLVVHPRNDDDADYIERVWRSNGGDVSRHFQDEHRSY